MRVTVSEGQANVFTSDAPNEAQHICVAGYTVFVTTQKQLADLYSCLHYVFGKGE